jgi:sarcosine oxidase
MGCAAAWALRERGADVTLIEQFEPGTRRGSSHGRSRIFRLAYPEAHWVRFAQEALAGWRDLERHAGERLLGLHGLIELATRAEGTSRDALAGGAVDHCELSAQEARAHGVALPDGWSALWQTDAGIVRADLAIAAFRGDLPVVVRRVDSLDDVDAEVVVVTAGAWITQLVPDVPVRVTRETVAYFTARGAPMPSVVELDDATRHHAMYALHDPAHGLKAGAHHAGLAADPDVEGHPDPLLVDRIATWVGERFPEVEPSPVGAETCLYTSTDDESFVLERRDRLVIGSACSGHGFKFAPAVGRRLADLALG